MYQKNAPGVKDRDNRAFGLLATPHENASFAVVFPYTARTEEKKERKGASEGLCARVSKDKPSSLAEAHVLSNIETHPIKPNGRATARELYLIKQKERVGIAWIACTNSPKLFLRYACEI